MPRVNPAPQQKKYFKICLANPGICVAKVSAEGLMRQGRNQHWYRFIFRISLLGFIAQLFARGGAAYQSPPDPVDHHGSTAFSESGGARLIMVSANLILKDLQIGWA